MQLQLEINQQLLEEAQGLEAGSDLDLQMLIENALREYIGQRGEKVQDLPLVDKSMVKAEIDKIFLSMGLNLDLEPVPFNVLQKQMRVRLGDIDLSQAIIDAREE